MATEQEHIRRARIALVNNRTLARDEDGLGPQILDMANALNSKTSALLTHVSVMIAICLWLYAYFAAKTIRTPWIEKTLLVEALLYTGISLLCLRTLMMTDVDESEEIPKFKLIEARSVEVRMRLLYYRWALWATVALTVALVIMFLFETVRSLA